MTGMVNIADMPCAGLLVLNGKGYYVDFLHSQPEGGVGMNEVGIY